MNEEQINEILKLVFIQISSYKEKINYFRESIDKEKALEKMFDNYIEETKNKKLNVLPNKEKKILLLPEKASEVKPEMENKTDGINFSEDDLKKIFEMAKPMILEYIKNEIISDPNTSTNNINKAKRDIPIKKFSWKDTEASLIFLIEILYDAQFISQTDYFQRFAILRDTFLNKDDEPFKNKQLSKTKATKVSKFNRDKFEVMAKLIDKGLKGKYP